MPHTIQRKNKTVRFRITSGQYDRLLNIVKARDFSTVSDYLRFIAFEKDLLFEMRFNEMHNAIIGIKEKIENNKEPKIIKEKVREEYLI